jgi:tetratricopeptide (TPR) repeat protein
MAFLDRLTGLALVVLLVAVPVRNGFSVYAFQSGQNAPSRPVDDLAGRAAAARDSGQVEEALALYRRALLARPDFDEGRWYIGTLLYELDRYSEAKETFSEVLRREPTHAGALGMRGLC